MCLAATVVPTNQVLDMLFTKLLPVVCCRHLKEVAAKEETEQQLESRVTTVLADNNVSGCICMVFVPYVMLNLLQSVKYKGSSATTIGSSKSIVDMQHVVCTTSLRRCGMFPTLHLV